MKISSFSISSRTLSGLCLTAVALAVTACGGGSDDVTPLTNQLYTQTNDASNAVVHMARAADGSITVKNRTATGGAGLDGIEPGNTTAGPDSLVSGKSVILSTDKKQLFAVNAGDSSVSVFSVNQTTGDLTLVKKTQTLGTNPTSLAYRNNVLYVVFQNGASQVGSYTVQADGALTQRGLYALPAAGFKPTQVEISPDARFAVVGAGTGSNTVVSYPLNADGTLGTPVANTTGIVSPFAGGFVSNTVYLQTSASGQSLGSYTFSAAGALTLIGSAIAGQAGPCWLVIAPNGKFVYVGNASGAISSFAIGATGGLTLLNASAAFEAGVITGVPGVGGDSWISADGKYLYSTFLGDDKVVAYSIATDGTLTKVNEQVIGTVSHVSLAGLVGI